MNSPFPTQDKTHETPGCQTLGIRQALEARRSKAALPRTGSRPSDSATHQRGLRPNPRIEGRVDTIITSRENVCSVCIQLRNTRHAKAQAVMIYHKQKNPSVKQNPTCQGVGVSESGDKTFSYYA